jgi:hypothetical protein
VLVTPKFMVDKMTFLSEFLKSLAGTGLFFSGSCQPWLKEGDGRLPA